MAEAEEIKLPQHQMELPAGTTCPNLAPGETEEDIGLTITTCPACGSRFVYSFKTENWIPEDSFEASLQANPPKISGL